MIIIMADHTQISIIFIQHTIRAVYAIKSSWLTVAVDYDRLGYTTLNQLIESIYFMYTGFDSCLSIC